MVNFLHNLTALAGAATVVNIVDFKERVINLAGNNGTVGTPIIGYPNTPGAGNQNWVITPQGSGSTFTIQSFSQPALFVSYDATFAGGGVTWHLQATGSTSNPVVFKMQTVNSGPAVNIIDTATGLALTSWVNADATYSDLSTPVTLEPLNSPAASMQSYTITGI